MREILFHVACSIATLGAAIAGSRAERRVRAALGFALVAMLLSVSVGSFVLSGGMPAFAFIRLAAGFGVIELPILIIGFVAMAPPSWRKRRAVGALAVLCVAGVAVDAFLIEPRALEVRYETVRSARVSSPLRIVVLTDVQTDAPGDYEREVMRRAADLEPDLVLLPGDYIQLPDGDAYVEAAHRLGQMFDTLRPRLGTFAVRGNVEHDDFVRDVFAGTRIRAVDETTRFEVGSIDVVALSFDDSFDPELGWPASERFQVVFGHGPDFMLGDVRGDLLVAGHTHGGQLQIPFFGPPLTLSTVPREWAAGGHWEHPVGRHLVVSRGIGMERGSAPRFRFRCHPEIVVIDLAPLE